MKLSEFELIERVKGLFGREEDRVELSVGDDAAVLRCGELYQMLTCDALTEGSHYLKRWKERVEGFYRKLGKKLINVNASDVASMGGEPRFSLITACFTKESSEEEAQEFFRGVKEAAEELGVAVVGGDTIKGKGELFDCFMVGESSEGYMVRGGAGPGELVGITGTVGDARGGLEILLKGMEVNDYLVNRFLCPTARVKEGRGAVKLGVKCATDVSDGLVFNLHTIAQSSKVAIEVESEKIPLSKELVRVFGKERALHFALYGGEDYELIITFPESLKGKVERIGFKVIGRVREGEGVFVDGKPASPKGFDHFKEE